MKTINWITRDKIKLEVKAAVTRLNGQKWGLPCDQGDYSIVDTQTQRKKTEINEEVRANGTKAVHEWWIWGLGLGCGWKYGWGWMIDAFLIILARSWAFCLVRRVRREGQLSEESSWEGESNQRLLQSLAANFWTASSLLVNMVECWSQTELQ